MILGTSAPSAVVSLMTISPSYTRPASAASVCPESRSALSLAAATSTARPASSVPREPVVCPQPSSWLVSTLGTKVDAGSPVVSTANCTSMVISPWPISVKPLNSVTWPSVSTTSRALPHSCTPLPMPLFFTPQAMPTARPSRTAAS